MTRAHADRLVTVVVPARNEAVGIGACLDSILAQDWAEFEVVVVDGASDDSTAEIVEGYRRRDPRVRLVTNPRKTIPVSLNLALGCAKGAWLVRVDAHSTIPANYIRLAAEHLRTGAYGGVGGRKDAVGRTPAGRAIAAAMASRFGVGGSTYHFGTIRRDVDHVPFGAYPVALLREVGGWDETLTDNEDFELDFRLRQIGQRLLFDPALRIEWQSRQSIRDLFRQYNRYGKGKAAVVRLHPMSMRPRHGAPPAIVLLLAGALVVTVSRPRTGLALVSPYLAAVAGASLWTARSLDPKARPYVAPAFLAMHMGWGLGFWQGTLRLAAVRSDLFPLLRRTPHRRRGRSGVLAVGC